MNTQETKAAAAVMIAFAEGKKIEYRVRCGARGWQHLKLDESDGVDWDWGTYDFRIAPAPTEVEVWVHEDGTVVGPATINREHMEEGGYTLRRATIHPQP